MAINCFYIATFPDYAKKEDMLRRFDNNGDLSHFDVSVHSGGELNLSSREVHFIIFNGVDSVDTSVFIKARAVNCSSL